MRDYQGGPLCVLNYARDREGLAASGDSEQDLVSRSITEAADQCLDCLRLVATGLIVGFQGERHNQ